MDDLEQVKPEETGDRMSQLPDEILISILSWLPLREATATSVLSSRWQSLHTHSTLLDFPPFKPEPCHRALKYIGKIPEKTFSDYISIINRILVSQKPAAGRIKEFRVRMPCLEGADIQRWLEFALSSKVEILEIRMLYNLLYLFGSSPRHHYSFRLSKDVSSRVLVGLGCLKDLSLSAVHVDDETVQILLSNSPLLESLSFEFCKTLTKVSVVGSPARLLKHLGMSFCSSLQNIEIRDMMELVSLRCYRNKPTVCVLSNVPKLIEFHTSDYDGYTIAQNLQTIPSCILDQLRLLKLWTNPYLIPYRSRKYMIPKLVNVKHLELEVLLWQGRKNLNFYALLPLLDACRSLEELHIKLSGFFYDDKVYSYSASFVRKLLPKLRKLKLSRYEGTQTELRFALLLLSCCVDALQELVVQVQSDKIAEDQARMHFSTSVPKTVKLIIISTTNT